ncbi:hypothetical protein ACT453_42215, partial [Bacillus sp. D-CC]
KRRKALFQKAGCGTALEEVNSLTDYMLKYAEIILEKVSHVVKPFYIPLINLPLELFLSEREEIIMIGETFKNLLISLANLLEGYRMVSPHVIPSLI